MKTLDESLKETFEILLEANSGRKPDGIATGYKVRAGSVHEDGTTFTAIDGDDHEYYKVVSSLDSMSCEIKDVIDNANRIVLTFDRDVNDSCGKAKVVNICDWLLN